MKAITLHGPWASLIAFGLKTIETRRHARLRGLVGQTIAIHAGQKRVEIDWAEIRRRYCSDIYRHSNALLHEVLSHSLDHPGCVVGTVYVKDHRRLTVADSRAALSPVDGLYGLILEDVRRFREPIRATGHQGPWDWEPPTNWKDLLI